MKCAFLNVPETTCRRKALGSTCIETCWRKVRGSFAEGFTTARLRLTTATPKMCCFNHASTPELLSMPCPQTFPSLATALRKMSCTGTAAERLLRVVLVSQRCHRCPCRSINTRGLGSIARLVAKREPACTCYVVVSFSRKTLSVRGNCRVGFVEN